MVRLSTFVESLTNAKEQGTRIIIKIGLILLVISSRHCVHHTTVNGRFTVSNTVDEELLWSRGRTHAGKSLKKLAFVEKTISFVPVKHKTSNSHGEKTHKTAVGLEFSFDFNTLFPSWLSTFVESLTNAKEQGTRIIIKIGLILLVISSRHLYFGLPIHHR